jgi:outer membrane protein assembly factor BamA
LVKNNIVRGDNKGVDLSDEKDNLRQKPNRELIGFVKFHLWAYQYGNKGLGIRKKQPWLRRLAEKVGEAPVLIDSSKMDITAQKMSDYYFSKGFLDNKVSYTIHPKRILKKRATVVYSVNLHDYNLLNSVVYNVTSKAIDRELTKSKDQQKLKVGQRLDFDKIEAERNRITELLKNNGFYYFNSSFIDFQIDTNQRKLRADVVINVRNRKNYEPHYQQTVDKITVIIGDASKKDTLFYKGINFIEGSYYIKPSSLSKNIIFRTNELYNASRVQKTYSNLLSMGLFNFVTIRFAPSQTDSLQRLDATIILQTAPKHDFIWEPQVISTGQSNGIQAGTERNYGLANSFTLQNRNVFGGAETFNISSLTALETQLKKDDQGLFNSFRQSINTELVIPSLVFFERKKISEVFVKKSTKFNASFLHDRNVNFTRNVIPFSFTYAFSKGRTSYGITPFRLSINQAEVEPNFFASLDAVTQFYTTQLLTNNLIAGPTASLYWNNKDADPSKYWQIRSNVLELSGNLASLYFNLFTNETGINKEIRGVKYSQYARSDIDGVYNYIIDENNAVATRAYFGAGLPYGNTEFLPFERRFFVGGGNSLRAWRPRTIGPGSYSDTLSAISIEKTGELTLMASAEYRFDIIDKYLDGAIFLDAGNIWNFREDANFKNANFQFDRFYKEIAINSGVGLRFDLTYVVFRTDWGIALHDPSKSEAERWVIKDFFDQGWIIDNTAINFAIGFPF